MLRKILFFIIVGAGMLSAQQKTVTCGPLTELPRRDEAMQKWRENRLGQFMHWGLYAIPAGMWEGELYDGAAEWLPQWAKITDREWQELRHQFNPDQMNADAWAAMASEMGARYMTITTKHHDGFCLWPSRYTDFTVEATPYGKDVLGPLVRAYTKAGVDVYFYYSILDWHHPDWRYDIKCADDSLAFGRYKTFVQNQLTELIERYPEVKGFWFDGTWDASWKKNGRFSYELEKALKALKPDLIVNSRLRADEYGSRHFDSLGRLMGDYESGYERRLPAPWDSSVVKRDWECCMTAVHNQWGYHRQWKKEEVKSPAELLEMLAQCVSQNGNFLLNFGPRADGTFRVEEVKMAKAIGRWMQRNGEAIWGCGPAPFIKQDWGYYTYNRDSGRLFLIVFHQPLSGQCRLVLNRHWRIDQCRLLGAGSMGLPIVKRPDDVYRVDVSSIDSQDPYVLTAPLIAVE